MSDDGDEMVVFDEVIVKAATKKAILCEIEGEDYWIPRSQLGDETDVDESGDAGQIAIPKWLARAKNLE
jgi:hypothetical protein